MLVPLVGFGHLLSKGEVSGVAQAILRANSMVVKQSKRVFFMIKHY